MYDLGQRLTDIKDRHQSAQALASHYRSLWIRDRSNVDKRDRYDAAHRMENRLRREALTLSLLMRAEAKSCTGAQGALL